MHTFLLVAGDDVHEELLPFSVHDEVEPYEVFLSDDETQSMAEHYGVPGEDLATLASKMQDWVHYEGFVRKGRLGYISTRNPRGRYDWYQVGGKWANALRLRLPRPARRILGLIPFGSTLRATSARKSDVDEQPLLLDPPAALLFSGEWFASAIFAEGETREKWRAEFARHFGRIPENTLLTVVDVRS